MLDHIGLFVPASLFAETLAFYDAALEPLGYKRRDFITGQIVGYAMVHNAFDLWIHKKDASPNAPVHLAFQAENHSQVDEFHQNGLRAGGTDNGKPGIRKMYHPNYYAAFLKDPCG
ncbi:glyoxalase/bleomycin resistance protein/dioxygenase [Lizonia empirigonia]|nr:glyoxalase/bleomycin resistance protein/dioxygenase [Lizonia empirigonia]